MRTCTECSLVNTRSTLCDTCGVAERARREVKRRLKRQRPEEVKKRKRIRLQQQRERRENLTVEQRREWSRYQHEYRRALRLEVLGHYSPNGPACACCGEATIEFLCIDHVNGGGGKHRRSIRGNLYNWLKREGFPKGFRVLCHNCNAAIGYYGHCPHAA